MKKLSKKQKLIGFIAILIVAVIIAIVITKSIIRNNNKIASEGYFSTTANAGSNLIANYILNGITIGGITGKMDILNTHDATAYALDIEYGKVAYARGERIVGTRIDADTVLDSYEIYYADINDDGTVDGVIFADLAVGGSGEWGSNGWGTYTIPKEENLKSYYIKKENYTDDSFKKSGKVIAPMKETRGKERFYVMALDDITPGTRYSWYDAAFENGGKLEGPFIGTSENDFAAAGVEPTGKLNTEKMIKSWNSSQYGAQNDNGTYLDMWGVIQDKVAEGWFVPSKSEWAAFGAAFGITSSNYSKTYGLDRYYWSSSQGTTYSVYSECFSDDTIHYAGETSYRYVRLATTF